MEFLAVIQTLAGFIVGYLFGTFVLIPWIEKRGWFR